MPTTPPGLRAERLFILEAVAASYAHEVKGLLTVAAMCGALGPSPNAREAAEALRHVRESGEALHARTSLFDRAVARSGSARGPASVDLAQTLREAVMLLSPAYRRSGVTARLDLGPAVCALTHADALQLALGIALCAVMLADSGVSQEARFTTSSDGSSVRLVAEVPASVSVAELAASPRLGFDEALTNGRLRAPALAGASARVEPLGGRAYAEPFGSSVRIVVELPTGARV